MKTRFIICFFLLVIISIISYTTLFIHPNQVTNTEALFKLPTSIAVSDKYIFLYDGVFNQILIYDHSMNFNKRVMVSSANSLISCNSEGNLCRVTMKSGKKYIYDENFEVFEITDAQDYERDFRISRKHTAIVNGVSYKLNPNIFCRSIVTVTANGISENYNVGSLSQIILQNIIILCFVLFTIYTLSGLIGGIASIYEQ